MVKQTKRKKEFKNIPEGSAVQSLEDGVGCIAKFPKVKFDETVELHFQLNINPKSSDQAVRGTVMLPHGTGKKIRIAVVCKGENVQKAEELGADYVGSNDLIEKIANGFMDFDCVIATPDMMRDLSKLGKILGPRGMMPSPKAGTVSADLDRVIKEIKAGRVEFKSDKLGGLHVGIGKRSFESGKVLENAQQVINAITNAKPAAVKGNLIKSLVLSTTMGPGLKISV